MSQSSSYPPGAYPPGPSSSGGYGYPAQPGQQASHAQPGQWASQVQPGQQAQRPAFAPAGYQAPQALPAQPGPQPPQAYSTTPPLQQGQPAQQVPQGYPASPVEQAPQHPAQSAQQAPQLSAPPDQLPRQLVRRATMVARVMGWVLLVLGVLLLPLGILLMFSGESGGGFFCAVLAVALVVVAPLPLRQRTVFDASGIHSRRYLGERHLPWPGSRGAFVVDLSMAGRYSKVATVEVSTPDGTTRLACPRVTSMNEEAARLAVEDDLDAIWAWATAVGYARETVPGQPQAGGAPGYGGPQPAPAGYSAQPAPAGYSATAGGRAGHGLAQPGSQGAPSGPVQGAPGGSLVPADPALLSQEPLVFKGWPGRRVEVIVYAVLSILLAAWGVFMLTTSSSSDPQGLISGAVLLAAAGGLVWASYTIAASTLTVSREGLACSNGVRTRRLAWPTSRSSVFVTAPRYQGRTMPMVHVLAPDGYDVRVPGLRLNAKNEAKVLRPAVQVAETIWMWGVSRGVARDDGGYLPAARAETEERRVAAARRIAYLLSQPGTGSQ